MAPDLAVAEWLQSSFKLCRAYGISNVLALHKLSDFGTAGADGSRARGSPRRWSATPAAW